LPSFNHQQKMTKIILILLLNPKSILKLFSPHPNPLPASGERDLARR